jgi:hypothetical protein
MQSARAGQRPQISEAVHSALVEAWDMPADDLFQIFHLHDADDLIFSRTYPKANRSDIVFVQILAFRNSRVRVSSSTGCVRPASSVTKS